MGLTDHEQRRNGNPVMIFVAIRISFCLFELPPSEGPQRLKPRRICGNCGMTEVMP